MDNLIKLSSVTQALKARDILKNNGISSKIHRIPAQKGKGSCSYGLIITKDIKKAIEILYDNEINVVGRA